MVGDLACHVQTIGKRLDSGLVEEGRRGHWYCNSVLRNLAVSHQSSRFGHTGRIGVVVTKHSLVPEGNTACQRES
jgi:hypothetical protein